MPNILEIGFKFANTDLSIFFINDDEICIPCLSSIRIAVCMYTKKINPFLSSYLHGIWYKL